MYCHGGVTEVSGHPGDLCLQSTVYFWKMQTAFLIYFLCVLLCVLCERCENGFLQYISVIYSIDNC